MGMRRGECAGLVVEDLDFELDVVRIRGESSKTRRGRNAPFGPKTAKALDRYLRVRKGHPAAGQVLIDPRTNDVIGRPLWLGRKGTLTANGILQMIRRRGRGAGIDQLHPHLFRHTFADSMLRLGMQEGDLMRLGGWRSRGMLQRYGAGAADERALASYQRISKRDALR
jgi:integrase